MKVKEVLSLAAEELGLDRAVAYLTASATTAGNTVATAATAAAAATATATDAGAREAAALLRCYNLVENEIALDYLPLQREDTAETEDGVLEYALLTRAAVRILRVLDESGNPLPFRIYPAYLKTQPGRIVVRYAYTPEAKGEGEDAEVAPQVSPRLLAYGIAAEYLLSSGLYEESTVWDGKYKDALTAAHRACRSRIVSSRRWA